MSAICRWLTVFACCAMLPRAHAQPSFDTVFTAPEGSQLSGLTLAEDGTLYATLARGGAHNQGAVVVRTPDGTVRVLSSFKAALGGQPMAAMIFGPDGALYGTTSSGGEHGFGTLFRLTRAGVLSALHHFALEEGGASRAPLLLADDGNFWGVTSGETEWKCDDPGAACTFVVHSTGQVFKLTPAGMWSSAFAGLTAPSSGLMQASTGDLYGTVSRIAGGTSHSGDVARGDVYRVTLDGQVTFGEGAFGYDFDPGGELVEAADGYLYGVSREPLFSPRPNVFRFSPYYSSVGAMLTRVAPDGRVPGGLAFGSDGSLYGAGQAGFFRTTRSGLLTHLRAYDQDVTPPTAAIVSDAAAGFFVPAGERLLHLQQTGRVEALHQFGFHEGDALRSLLVTRRGELYGATSRGGNYDFGTLFRIDAAGTLSVLHHFAGDQALLTPLVEALDGNIYTVLNSDLVRVTAEQGVVPVHGFGQAGVTTDFLGGLSFLVQGKDRALYGSMRSSSPEARGSLYRYDLDTSAVREVAQTSGLLGPCVQASSGDFYALQYRGSPDGLYDLLRITPAGEVILLHAFGRAAPTSDLAEGPDGAIYVIGSDDPGDDKSVYRWTSANLLERYYPLISAASHQHLAFDTTGNLFVSAPGIARTASALDVITPSRSHASFTAGLGIIAAPSGELLRVAPLERDGYQGFRIEPLTPP